MLFKSSLGSTRRYHIYTLLRGPFHVCSIQPPGDADDEELSDDDEGGGDPANPANLATKLTAALTPTLRAASAVKYIYIYIFVNIYRYIM